MNEYSPLHSTGTVIIDSRIDLGVFEIESGESMFKETNPDKIYRIRINSDAFFIAKICVKKENRTQYQRLSEDEKKEVSSGLEEKIDDINLSIRYINSLTGQSEEFTKRIGRAEDFISCLDLPSNPLM